MPQQVPFYFVNEIIFGYSILFLLIFLFSKFILPKIPELYLTRLTMIRL